MTARALTRLRSFLACVGAIVVRLAVAALLGVVAPVVAPVSAPGRTLVSVASADERPLARDALPGGRDVGSALDQGQDLRMRAGAEYAHTEDVLHQDDGHDRLTGELAGSFAYARWLSMSLLLGARVDKHRGALGSDTSRSTSTRIATRHAFDIDSDLSLALGTALAFPGADNASRGFRAASFDLLGLLSYKLPKRVELSFQLGYRFDGSENAIRAPQLLSAADRLAASLSSYDSVLIGAFASLPLRGLTLLGEWSWEPGVGASAPSAFDSPMRLSAGAQTALGGEPEGGGARFFAGGWVGFSPSGRPTFQGLVRIEPRFWMSVFAGVSFGKTQEKPPETRVFLMATDVTGAPLPAATANVTDATGTSSVPVGTNGQATFVVRQGQPAHVSVEEPGFVSEEAVIDTSQPQAEVALQLQRALPEGEIKGRVRSLHGGPLVAHIEVVPLGVLFESGPDGTFRVDVPPGHYTLRISAEGHDTQERSTTVERLGVTILVIDLRRLPDP
jgi:hypothetical protein